MYNTSICHGANYYNHISYIFSKSVIHPHLDRIYFSCRSIIGIPEETLFSILHDNGYRCESDGFAEGKVYERIRIFESRITGMKVSILYNRTPCHRFYPCMGINIYKPDIKTVDWFDAICNSLGFITTLSHVELTIDFSPYEYGLQEFFWKHLFLKYHGGNVRFIGDYISKSLYLGHKAKNSKSVIVYDRKVNDLNVLRLEFRLNRSFLKRFDLELDCFEKINNIDLSGLISFKKLNYEKLSKYFQWRHKSQILRLGEGYRSMYIRQLMSYLGDERSVANEISCMKKSPYKNNCQRFFEDMPEANEALFGRLKNVKVI